MHFKVIVKMSLSQLWSWTFQKSSNHI